MAPRDPVSPRIPQVYLTLLRIGETAALVPARGAVTLPRLKVHAPRDAVRIEYVAPGVHAQPVRYQRRLRGVEAEWSAAGAERTATYSGLPPGSHEFMVRAVAPDGTVGELAAVAIDVPHPMWVHLAWMLAVPAVVLIASRSLRQLQRTNGRRNLTGMPLRVFGGMEQQAEDGRRHRGAADSPRLGQR